MNIQFLEIRTEKSSFFHAIKKKKTILFLFLWGIISHEAARKFNEKSELIDFYI